MGFYTRKLELRRSLRLSIAREAGEASVARSARSAELEAPAAQAATKELREHLRKGPVTLLYASRDEAHNNAVALKAWLARPRKRREDPAS